MTPKLLLSLDLLTPLETTLQCVGWVFSGSYRCSVAEIRGHLCQLFTM